MGLIWHNSGEFPNCSGAVEGASLDATGPGLGSTCPGSSGPFYPCRLTLYLKWGLDDRARRWIDHDWNHSALVVRSSPARGRRSAAGCLRLAGARANYHCPFGCHPDESGFGCFTNITAPGYTYAPGENVETTDSITVQ